MNNEDTYEDDGFTNIEKACLFVAPIVVIYLIAQIIRWVVR